MAADHSTPDFTALADLASAHAMALDWLAPRDGGAFEFFNLGTGTGYSVLDIAAAVERVTGKPIRRVIGERRPGDPPELVASGAKAARVLGWRPERSGLETVVGTADRWYRKHFMGERV